MADEEDNIKEQETFSEAQKPEAAAQYVAKDEEKPIEANTMIKEFNSFTSTTETMKTAARSKVETLISQVKEKLNPAKDSNKQLDDQDTDQSKADGLGMINDDIEQHYIDALCDSIVGGNFDLELNYDIRDPFDVLTVFELFERVSTKSKFQILVVLHAILKKSVENLQTCTKAGLITMLLERISKYSDDMIADKMVELVGVLATYSITIKELKYFLAALQVKDNGKWPQHAFRLLGILKRMPEKHGPDVYFDFSGKSGSDIVATKEPRKRGSQSLRSIVLVAPLSSRAIHKGIVIPPMTRWPHQPGFSFATWLQLDAAHLSSVEQNMKPHIYSFMNNKGIGYSAHFSGPMLVIEVHGKANKVFTILIKFEFRPQIWYHVCVSHVYNRFKASEIRCYVNGQMVTQGEIHIPSSKEAMERCFVGFGQTGKALDHKYSFKGQMSAFYLFGEPLSQSATAAIYRLGPGYKGKFKFESELDIPLYEMDKKTLFDGKLASSIIFTFNPKAVEGQLCLESSPNDSKIYFMHSSRAIMLEGVQSVVTQSLQAALHSLGGIQMLYPLFTQLDCPFHGQEKPEGKLCILLLGLVYDLLRGSAMCQQQFLQSQGFLIIGHILEKSSECHLTEEVVDILLGLARYLMSTPSASGLLGSLLDHILLNPALWIKTPLTLQANLLSLFATGYVGGLDYAGYIRKEVGVPRLMLMLRKYYSLGSSSANPATVGSTKEEIISLRAFMLLLIKQMVIKGDGILDEELRSILVYLTIEDEEENLIDVLHFLLGILCEMSDKIIVCFDNLEGFRILFLKLLISKKSEVRVYCLKIVAAYIKYLTLQRKMELVEKYGFITMIGKKLMPTELTSVTYNALFEILTARVTKHVITGRHAEPDSTITIYHPTILPIMVDLILRKRRHSFQQAASTESNAESHKVEEEDITRVFLSDLVLLLNHSKDNRSHVIRFTEEARVTDTVFTIIRMLLHYAIQNEKEGWRVWVDTLAILHGRISAYNARKERLSKEQTRDPEPLDTQELSVFYKDRSVDLETGEAKPAQVKDNRDDKETGISDETVEHKSGSEEDKDGAVGEDPSDKTEPKSTSSSKSQSPSHKDDENKETATETEMDIRKKFFYSILQGGNKDKATDLERSEQTTAEALKRSQSESDISQSLDATNDEATDGESKGVDVNNITRPRSASPTVGTQGKGGIESDAMSDTDNKGPDEGPIEAVNGEIGGEETAEKLAEDGAGSKVNDSIATVKSAKTIHRRHSDDVSSDKSRSTKTPPPPTKSKSLDYDVGPEAIMKTTFIGAPPDEPEIEASPKTNDDLNGTASNTSTPKGKCRPYIDIPEFSWSELHQRLLTELLFAVESDLQVWKTHTRKSINDFISNRENQVYVVNLCHMVSILSDSLIYCCGGLLPLLSSATSRNFASDVLEACGGMTLDASFSFLNRVMDLVDIVAFASSVSFSSVEAHRNMSAGGVLRQCIRLVFCSAARNRVVCRQREPLHWSSGMHKQVMPKSMKETEDAIKTLIASTKPATKEDIVQNIPGHITTITQPERLLQDTDLNRLRALVYREVEDSRQSQYIALVVVYYVAVLMVARYRDILENETDDLVVKRRYSTTENQTNKGHRQRAATWASSGNQPLSAAFRSADERVSKEDGVDEATPQEAASPPEVALSLEERIDLAFKSSCSLLKEILFDFAHYLSRILVGSRGQDLIADGLGSLKSEDSTVELVMLLCSQEWQNSLQKHAGAAFVDLINEGRLISHSTRERIVITASEARDILKEKEDVDGKRHGQFDDICFKTEVLYQNENKTYEEFFKAKRRRNSAFAEKLLEKTFDILTSEYGAWPMPERADYHVFYKLDHWEDCLRRRMRLVKNPLGTTHPEAILAPIAEEDLPKVKSSPNLKYHLYRQKTLDQTSNGSTSEEETEEGEPDVDLTRDEFMDKEEKQIEVLHTVKCHVIAPGTLVAGTLAIANSYLYFTADEEDLAVKKIDPAVRELECN
eukprot:gene600-10293_t